MRCALKDRYEWLTSVGGGRTEERNIKQQRPPKEGDGQEREGGPETGRPRDRKEAPVWPRGVGAFPSSSEGSPLPGALGRPILCVFHFQNKPSLHQSPTFGPTLYKFIVMGSVWKPWPYNTHIWVLIILGARVTHFLSYRDIYEFYSFFFCFFFWIYKMSLLLFFLIGYFMVFIYLFYIRLFIFYTTLTHLEQKLKKKKKLK